MCPGATQHHTHRRFSVRIQIYTALAYARFRKDSSLPNEWGKSRYHTYADDLKFCMRDEICRGRWMLKTTKILTLQEFTRQSHGWDLLSTQKEDISVTDLYIIRLTQAYSPRLYLKPSGLWNKSPPLTVPHLTYSQVLMNFWHVLWPVVESIISGCFCLSPVITDSLKSPNPKFPEMHVSAHSPAPTHPEMPRVLRWCS